MPHLYQTDLEILQRRRARDWDIDHGPDTPGYELMHNQVTRQSTAAVQVPHKDKASGSNPLVATTQAP